MRLDEAIARSFTVLGEVYGRPYTVKQAEVWLTLLEGSKPASVFQAVLDYCRSDREFPPKPGQIREAAQALQDPDATITPEEILQRGVNDPEGFWGLLCRRAGALRAGARYDDGSGAWYAPSAENDPIGRATALKAVRDVLGALRAHPPSMAELKRHAEENARRLAVNPSPGLGLAGDLIGDITRALGEEIE